MRISQAKDVPIQKSHFNTSWTATQIQSVKKYIRILDADENCSSSNAFIDTSDDNVEYFKIRQLSYCDKVVNTAVNQKVKEELLPNITLRDDNDIEHFKISQLSYCNIIDENAVKKTLDGDLWPKYAFSNNTDLELFKTSQLSYCTQVEDTAGKYEVGGCDLLPNYTIPHDILEEINVGQLSCCNNIQDSQQSNIRGLEILPSYTMSLGILEKIGNNSVFDSHCHLDFILRQKVKMSSRDDFKSFVERFPLMMHPSLNGFITNFCRPTTWTQYLESPLVKSMLESRGVYYTIGCHPHYAADMVRFNKFLLMKDLISKTKADPKCVAIGECGLDTSKKNCATMQDQIEVFKFQIKLAMYRGKPLVLHIRGAEREALSVLKESGLPSFWPIHRHCWNNSWDVCQKWLTRFPESVIGLTGLITYPGNRNLREVAEKISLDRLVIETDAPYFLPQGGGKEGLLGHSSREFSVPLHAVNVAAQVASIRKCTVQEVLRANKDNVKRIYGIQSL